MLQETINLIFILSFYWEPSYSSICYLFTGFYLWLACTFLSSSTRLIYKTSMILSASFLLLKSLVILNLYFSDYFLLVSKYPSILEAISINPSESMPSLLLHLLPDSVILFTSSFAYLLSLKSYISKSSSTLYKFLGIVSLWLCSCSNSNFPGIIYNLTFIFWAISEGVFKNKINYKIFTGFISFLSFSQVLLSLSWPLTSLSQTDEKIILIGKVKIDSFQMMTLLVLSLVSSNARRDLVSFNVSLQEPLLECSISFKRKILALVINFLLKVGLFLWIEFNPGWTGIFLILCTGFLILEKDVEIISKMLKVILIPLLVASYLFDYLWNIYPKDTLIETSVVTLMKSLYMLFTIMLSAFLCKFSEVLDKIDYSPQPTWHGKILVVFISHIYLFSLMVLFVIGLSDINLLHTGLMILCLRYMSDVKHVIRRWQWLIYYMIFMMFLRETWTNSKSLIPEKYQIHNSYVVKVLGLETEKERGEFTVKDGLNWILLFCCSLQFFANRHKFDEKLKDHSNYLFDLISDAYNYFSNIEFWLIYIVLFSASFFKDANILNFIRGFMVIFILARHLSSPYSKITSNFAKINTYLKILKVYCMVLLGTRYVYQFLKDFKQITKFEKLGLEVYDQTQDLYYNTSLDTILVVASVLAHRSNTYWKERHDSNGSRVSDLYKVKEKEREAGKFKYSLFYNIFSRPFQYILLVTIGSLCIFWKLSLTMYIFLIILCVYQLRISYSFYSASSNAKRVLDEYKVESEIIGMTYFRLKMNKPDSLKCLWISEWQLRAQLWRHLFTWTLSCILMSYIRYFSAIDIVSFDVFLDAIFLFVGYNDQQQSLILLESFGYFIILALLVIERQCLQYNMPKVLKSTEDGWVDSSIINQINTKLIENFQDNFELKDMPKRRDSNLIMRQRTMIYETESIEKIKKKIQFISALNLVKVLAEVLIPLSILLLAFYKLTIISTIYVFCVFFMLFLNKNNQTIVLNFVIIFCIFLQYGLNLSNISDKVSPEHILKSNEKVLQSIGIPWKGLLSLRPEEQEYFNLGTSHNQLTLMIIDILIQVFMLIYWFYLSKREVQLTYLQMRVPSEKNSLKLQEELRPTSFKGKVKMILYEIKLLFYKFARFSIVIIVLLFSSQNNGVLSLFYALFCLIFLYNENLIIYNSFNRAQDEESPKKITKTQKISTRENIFLPERENERSHSQEVEIPLLSHEENVEEEEEHLGIASYLNLLKYFLRLICFDLLFQVVVQIPFNEREADYEKLFGEEGWLTELGVYKLWNLTQGEKKFIEDRFTPIWIKILTFSILLVVEAMMKSRDFQVSHKRQCKSIQQESENIAEKMTHEFNRLRVQSNHINSQRKKNFQKDVEDLEKNVRIWNETFKEKDEKKIKSDFLLNNEKDDDEKNEEDGGKLKKLKRTVKRAMSLLSLRKNLIEESKLKNLGIKFHKKVEKKRGNFIIRSLVLSINRHLFEAFIRKVTIISSTLSDQQKFMQKSEEFDKKRQKFYYESENEERFAELETEVKKEIETNTEILKDYDYEVKVTDYPQLITYSLASNTQSLVYFLFILNHFHYGSMVSLVYPMTLFGFAMLEYPRPRMKYFRIMLVYTSCVLFIKFVFQLEILQKIDFFKYYQDPWNIGFKCVSGSCVDKSDGKKTNGISYDSDFLQYMLYDALVLFSLLCREYYMIRIGMWEKIETDRETLVEAKIRLKVDKNEQSEDLQDQLFQLQSKSTIVIRSNPGFFERLIPKNPGEKPGRDFYLFTFLMQLIILFYLFFFFNKLDGNSEDISQSFIANQFQGKMVISVVIVVILIIFDRYVYIQHTSIALNDTEEEENEYMNEVRKAKEFQKAFSIKKIAKRLLERASVDVNAKALSDRYEENKKKKVKHEKAIKKLMIIKLMLHSILLVVLHGMIFWYFTYLTEAPFYSEKNFYLQIFYVLYLVYLTFEAQQFRFGLPNFTDISFPLMRHISVYSSGLFKIYKGMPFLYELRTVIDWTFTRTSLNIYQWFKLEEIQTQLFYNECTQKSLKFKKHGDQIQLFEKIQFGACSLFVMLTVILLPLFLFSTLNPITEQNKVLSAGLNVNLIMGERWFRIYSLRSAEKIEKVTEEDFKNRFQRRTELRDTDYNLMYRIDMPETADVNWDITSYTEMQLRKRLEDILNQEKNETEVFQVEMELFITRKYPLNNPKVTFTKNYTLSPENAGVLFGMIAQKDNNSLEIKNFTYKVFRIPSAGDKIVPFSYKKDNYQRDLKLTLIHDYSGRFWNVSSHSFNDGLIGLRIYILSDNYSSVTFNFSIITFYISIVYFMGRIIRMVTVGNGLNIVMTDMKNCEHLRTLCAAIFISRMTGKLLKEEELYYELIDILRSPEFTKVLTGSSSIKVKKE